MSVFRGGLIGERSIYIVFLILFETRTSIMRYFVSSQFYKRNSS